METKANIQNLIVDGKIYVPLDSVLQKAEQLDGMDYVIVRTYSAGVHAGYLKSYLSGTKEVKLCSARRIWKWYGAATLSELATFGTNKPSDCKFGCPVGITLTEAIEIIVCTEQSRQSIQGVPQWKI